MPKEFCGTNSKLSSKPWAANKCTIEQPFSSTAIKCCNASVSFLIARMNLFRPSWTSILTFKSFQPEAPVWTKPYLSKTFVWFWKLGITPHGTIFKTGSEIKIHVIRVNKKQPVNNFSVMGRNSIACHIQFISPRNKIQKTIIFIRN